MEALLQIPFEECHSRLQDPLFQAHASALLSLSEPEPNITRVQVSKAPKLDSLAYLVMFLEVKQRFGWEIYRQVQCMK